MGEKDGIDPCLCVTYKKKKKILVQKKEQNYQSRSFFRAGFACLFVCFNIK